MHLYICTAYFDGIAFLFEFVRHFFVKGFQNFEKEIIFWLFSRPRNEEGVSISGNPYFLNGSRYKFQQYL